jgi:hypothetical protein
MTPDRNQESEIKFQATITERNRWIFRVIQMRSASNVLNGSPSFPLRDASCLINRGLRLSEALLEQPLQDL